MTHTTTRLEELKSIAYRVEQLIDRVENNRDNAEEEFMVRFICETFPIEKMEDAERIEIYYTMTTKKGRDKIIKAFGEGLKGLKC